MWHYMWGHIIYHLVRWFPRTNRTKISCVVMVLTASLMVPHIIVLTLNHTTRWCAYHLFEFLIVSLVFTLFTMGFAFLFLVMVPVPRAVKVTFHVFGIITFLIGVTHIVLTAKASDCRNSTEGLYILSFILAVFSGVSVAFFLLMFPFWLANAIWRGIGNNPSARTGICYEPVKCCSCIWHI